MSEIRGEIADDFERIYRKAVQTLEAACDTTTEYSAVCTNPRCGKTIKVQGYPDIRAITSALQFLADQGIGKPTQAKDDTPKLALTKPIANMTREERQTLQAMAEQLLWKHNNQQLDSIKGAKAALTVMKQAPDEGLATGSKGKAGVAHTRV